MTESTNYEEASAQVCRRCGVHGDGDHAPPGDRRCSGCGCIDALREMVARLEFKLERVTNRPVQPTQAGNRGGRRDRSDNRMVLLDGERVCLAAAARRLGISTSALHHRIIWRTRNPEYADVDLRAIGADRARSVGGIHPKYLEPQVGLRQASSESATAQ